MVPKKLSDGMAACLERSPDELAQLSPQDIEEYRLAHFFNVFGANAKIDSEGRPVEQGIGAPGRETPEHYAAIKAEKARALLIEAARRGDIQIADMPPIRQF
jgi:hypothetical protein